MIETMLKHAHKWMFVSTLRRNTAQILVVQFATIGLSLLLNIIIGRTLGPESKGILDIFRLMTAFIGDFGLLGIGSSLLYFYANQKKPFEQVHGTGIAYALIASLITLLIGLVGFSLWRDVFKGLHDWMLLLGFGLAPFIYYRAIWSPLTIGYGKPLLNFLMTLGVTLFNLLVVIILIAIRQMTLEAMVILTAVSLIIPAASGLLYFVRRTPTLPPSFALMRQALGYGFVVYVGAVANLLHFRIDQLMVGNLLDLRAVGIYAVSVRFAEMILLLDTPISTAALKRISSAQPTESFALTRKIALTQLIISGSVACGVALFAPLIVGLYGQEYTEAAAPLAWLMPGIVAWSSARVLSQYITYNRGKVWYPTLFSLTGLTMNIVLNAFLLPIYGIVGAAIASSASYSLVVVLVLVTFWRLQEVG